MSNSIVMYDSTEAASRKTVEGWVSRKGHFWGTDEHMARYDGCTHRACPECGVVYEIGSYCHPCQAKNRRDKFASFPIEKWDGDTPLCLFDAEYYFFDEDILDYIADLNPDEEPCICKCKPGYLSLVSDDNWCDDLPEDGELPEAVADAVAALNAVIRAQGPVCWYEDAIAIDVQDLRERLSKKVRVAVEVVE